MRFLSMFLLWAAAGAAFAQDTPPPATPDSGDVAFGGDLVAPTAPPRNAPQRDGSSTFLPNFHHLWNPVPGRGSTYRVLSMNRSDDVTFGIVGEKEGRLLFEMVASNKDGSLVVSIDTAGDPTVDANVRTMVVQGPGQAPALLEEDTVRRMLKDAGNLAASVGRLNGGAAESLGTSIGTVTDLGTESVVTPAGTFQCRKVKLGSGDDPNHPPTTVWLNEGAAPFGVVKILCPATMVDMQLTAQVATMKTAIKGTPVPARMNNLVVGSGNASQKPPEKWEMKTYAGEEVKPAPPAPKP